MKKVLLDENLPRPLAKLVTLDEIEVISVHDMGWAEKKNGELIRSMVQEDFQFMLTADKNLLLEVSKANSVKYERYKLADLMKETA